MRIPVFLLFYNKTLSVPLYILGFIVLFTFNTKKSLAEDALIFSASVGMPFSNPENTGFEDRLVKEIFKRLGKEVKVQFVPAERALHNLDEGIDDGAIGRVGGILKKYKNIRQIPEKAFDRDFMVFSRSKSFVPSNWASLRPYNIGFITGWKILENNIKEAKSIVKVKDGNQLFQLLEENRVDVVIYNRWGGLHLARKMGLKDVILLEPPLVQAPHFFNLNKKYEDLIIPAAQKLKDMRKDGTYERIFNETLAPLVRK